MYEDVIAEIKKNGNRVFDFSHDQLRATNFLAASPESYLRLYHTPDESIYISYGTTHFMYVIDGKLVLSITNFLGTHSMPKDIFNEHSETTYYEIENTGIIKEFVDMCNELYKNNAS